MAVLAISIQLAFVYMGLGSALWSVFLPKVTAMTAKESNEKEVSELFVRTGRLQFIVLLFVLLFFTVFGKSFIRLWAGTDYEDSFYLTWMFFASLLFTYAQNLGAVISQARNSVKPYALIRLVTSIIGLILSAVLSRSYGYYGCAIGISLALVLQTVVLNIYYERELHINIYAFLREVGKASWFPILICFITWFPFTKYQSNNLIILILVICVYASLFLLLCWFFSFNEYEKGLIKEMIRKLGTHSR